MITIKKTIRELYNQYIESIRDIVWDDPDTATFVGSVLKLLASRKIENIRQLFKDGNTCLMLTGEDMSLIDTPNGVRANVEVRIYDATTLIGVIIESELVY